MLGIIDDFMARRAPNQHVALHCTDGVNLTGFFACAYLLTRGRRLSTTEPVRAVQEAVRLVEAARSKKWYLKSPFLETLNAIAAARPK